MANTVLQTKILRITSLAITQIPLCDNCMCYGSMKCQSVTNTNITACTNKCRLANLTMVLLECKQHLRIKIYFILIAKIDNKSIDFRKH